MSPKLFLSQLLCLFPFKEKKPSKYFLDSCLEFFSCFSCDLTIDGYFYSASECLARELINNESSVPQVGFFMLTSIMSSALAPETTHSLSMRSSQSLCTDALKDLSKGKVASCAKPCWMIMHCLAMAIFVWWFCHVWGYLSCAKITLYPHSGQTGIDFAEVKG